MRIARGTEWQRRLMTHVAPCASRSLCATAHRLAAGLSQRYASLPGEVFDALGSRSR